MPTMMGSENIHFVDYCYDEMIGHGNIEDCELDETVFEFYKKEVFLFVVVLCICLYLTYLHLWNFFCFALLLQKIKQLKSKLTP